MAEGARIHSVDAVRHFRAALIKYAETGNVALSSADSDVDRVMGWLERDQTTYWANQVRKRHEFVIRCEDAVRQKRLFKGADGSTQSVVDEMKALQAAKRKKDEAEQKVLTVKKAIAVLRKEGQLYKGRTQKLGTTMTSDLPKAVYRLDRMMEQVEAYLQLQTTGRGIDLAKAAEAMAAGNAGGGPQSLLDKLRARTPYGRAAAGGTVRHAGGRRRGQPAVARRGRGRLAAGGPGRAEREAGLARAGPAGRVPPRRLAGAEAVPGPPGADRRRRQRVVRRPGRGRGRGRPGGGGVFGAMRIGNVIAARPDLADFLSMPAGTVAVLDAGGPTAVYDDVGLDVWAIALIQAAEPAADDGPTAGDGAAPADASTPTDAEAATTA